MSAPDFYFVNNAMFRHVHDRYGMDALVRYWRSIGERFYAARVERWRTLGAAEIARDWTAYSCIDACSSKRSSPQKVLNHNRNI